MRRLALLLIAGCYETPGPGPRPPGPQPLEVVPPGRVVPCTGPHAQVTDAWTLELFEAMPPLGDDRVVHLHGTRWVTTPISRIAGAPSNRFDFDKPYDTRVDRDGTVIFRGLWHGNPDQVNGIGDGLYRLDGKTAVPLVDPATLLPGSSATHFNSAGGFSVDQGWVAFWGGRPYEQSGVYLWRDGKVISIADTATSVHGTGVPSVRAGRIAFQGEQDGVRGIYLWDEGAGTKRILEQQSKPGNAIFGDVSLGDHVVYAGAFDPRRILAWSDGTEWVAAEAGWFRGTVGDDPSLEPTPLARGDELVVHVAQTTRSELWDVTGCTLERIAGTGDVVHGQTIAAVTTLRDLDAPRATEDFLFLAILADGSRHLVRAHHAVHTT